jgi:hypothetical protein
MKAQAEARGVEVIVKLETDGDLKDWTSARYSDKRKPSAYFLELTKECAC